MITDERTLALARHLQSTLGAVSDEQMARLVQEARREALAEARTILKGLMLQAMLERALGQGDVEKAVDRAGMPPPTPQAPLASEEVQIRQEIEAVRKKIAVNQASLSRFQAAPSAGQAGPAPSDNHQPEAIDSEAGAEHGYYVYGIVAGEPDGCPAELPEQGVDPNYPVYALPLVETVSDRPIQAIVGRVSLREFGEEELQARLEDAQWLEARVRAHERVLEALLDGYTVLPMRFCTIYHTEQGVQTMMARCYTEFVEQLSRLKGNQEWGVKVYCDDEALARHVLETSEQMQVLQTELGGMTSGAAYFARKRMEDVADAEVLRARDEHAQLSHDRLARNATEAAVGSLQVAALEDRKERLVLNGSYLVAGEDLAAFRDELQDLQQAYGALGFSYELTGPWPPHSFVAVDIEEPIVDE